MKIEYKAVLLSALVFPGTGHIYLKKYPIALAFICASAYLLFTLISLLNNIIQSIKLKINSGEIALNIDAITQAVSSHLAELPAQYSSVSYALLFIWCFSIADSYRLGKKSSTVSP
jgi:hypothetical protein